VIVWQLRKTVARPGVLQSVIFSMGTDSMTFILCCLEFETINLLRASKNPKMSKQVIVDKRKPLTLIIPYKLEICGRLAGIES
jgi:hypothetical protein